MYRYLVFPKDLFQDIHVKIFTFVHKLISFMLYTYIIHISYMYMLIYLTKKYPTSTYTNSPRGPVSYLFDLWIFSADMEWSRLLEEMNMVVSGSWDRTLRHWAATFFFFQVSWGFCQVGTPGFLAQVCFGPFCWCDRFVPLGSTQKTYSNHQDHDITTLVLFFSS